MFHTADPAKRKSLAGMNPLTSNSPTTFNVFLSKLFLGDREPLIKKRLFCKESVSVQKVCTVFIIN